jgi:hypothetical protein
VYLTFKEKFKVPANEVFSYFSSPKEWVRLFGTHKLPKDLGGGWYSVPLRYFPIPLVAKNVAVEKNKKVRWIFRGFWRGVGEVEFKSLSDGVSVEGFEYISPHGLWAAASLTERMFMDKEFHRIWNGGWKRIRHANKAS